nr:hypothetical protein [Tanacetum cinerariifolium]
MAASAIIVSFDSFDESVGSPPSRVILFVKTNLVASPTGLCGLVPYSDSNSDSPDGMDFPEYITSLPATSLFLYTDSSEASDSSDGPPSQDPYYCCSLEEQDHRPSSSSSPTNSLPVHSSGLDAPDQAHFGSSTRVVSPRLDYPLVRAPRHSEAFLRCEAFLHWCAAPFSTFYPSKSSSGDSSERPLHSSSNFAGPSRKRCWFPTDSLPLSTPVTGSLAPSRADLLPPCKRLRDSYSSETSMEEDTEIDTTETEDGRKLDIVDRDDVRDHVKIDPRDVRDDTEDYEADISVGDTVEVGIDSMSTPVADEESEEPAGEDSFDSSGTIKRGSFLVIKKNSQCVINDFENTLIDLKMALWIHGTILDRPTVTFYGDIRR